MVRSRRAARWAALAAAGATCLVPAAATAPQADVSGARAKATVIRLAGLGPRPAGSAAERRAAGVVEPRLRRYGYRIVIQNVPLPGGQVSQNVVGVTSSRPRVILAAHVDGVRAGPAANDNASGVAALLEIAAALRGTPGVWIAALGAEERVQTGSRIHLGSARLVRGLTPAGRRAVRFALSLDMVGVGARLHVRGLEPRPNRSARIALARARLLGLAAGYLQDAGESDHAEMTRAGLAAAWLQWRPDACWHRACDTAARVRAEKVAAAARLALAAARAALGPR